jgi:CBS domain-containing protein
MKVSWILARKKTAAVWSIGPNAMVIDAIRLMDEKNVGALPVMDNGKLVQCIIDLVIVYLLSLVGVNKTVEIGAA